MRAENRRRHIHVLLSKSRDDYDHHVSGFARGVLRFGRSQEARRPSPGVEGTPYLRGPDWMGVYQFRKLWSLAAMGHVQYVETYVSRRLRVEHAEVV